MTPLDAAGHLHFRPRCFDPQCPLQTAPLTNLHPSCTRALLWALRCSLLASARQSGKCFLWTSCGKSDLASAAKSGYFANYLFGEKSCSPHAGMCRAFLARRAFVTFPPCADNGTSSIHPAHTDSSTLRSIPCHHRRGVPSPAERPTHTPTHSPSPPAPARPSQYFSRLCHCGVSRCHCSTLTSFPRARPAPPQFGSRAKASGRARCEPSRSAPRPFRALSGERG